MTANRLRFIPALVPLFLLMSCGSEQQAQPQQQSYKDTKTMVLDVLKTEDAAKAIQEASTKSKDKTLQLLSTGEGQQIQLAVKDLLTTENHGVKMLEKTMTDPKFAGDFAKAAEKNIKQIQKDLLKDPDYQKSLIETMNNPDYQKIIMETMKNQKYRQQMKEVVIESLQSPIFKAELIGMFQRAVQEEMKPKEDKTILLSTEGDKKSGGGGGGGGGGDKKSGGESGDKKEGGGDQGGSEQGGGGGGGGSGGGGSESGGGQSGDESGGEEQSKDKKK